MNKENLKRIRKARGYTQESLASAMGITRGTIGNWEIGIRNPTSYLLIKLAATLGCSIDVLLRDEPVRKNELGGSDNG